MLKLSTPIEEVEGVGPKFGERLRRFGIKNIKDLLWHFPSRYQDFSTISKIVDLKINEQATVQGIIQEIKLKRTWKRRIFIVEALIADETGSIKAIWFNQRFLLSILKKGKLVNLAGKVTESKNGISLSHPTYELVGGKTEEEIKHTGRLVPIYPETRRLTSKGMRFLIKPILDELEELPEILPSEVLEKNNFPEINEALNKIHFPDDLEQIKKAKKRFAFEDLLSLQLINLRQRLKLDKQKAYSFSPDFEYLKKWLDKLPYELTNSQKSTLYEILKDLEKSRPMNRLLQGDVGSGKTIVAALTALMVAGKPLDSASLDNTRDKQGKQSAFMAPTEVLARQHYITFKKFFTDFEGGIGLLTSKEARIFYGDGLENEVKKQEFIKKIGNGNIKIIIGTHSLIQKSVIFNDLAFVVIDEQHRFGVEQRANLVKTSGTAFIPHFLSMSATPIPRTLTLTIFGDLDLSIINELPKGRKKIITKIVDPINRDKAYEFIREQIKKGRQTFVICPRIEKEESVGQKTVEEVNKMLANGNKVKFNSWSDVKAVKEEYEKLSQKVFSDLKVEMLHGKLKVKEKVEIMKRFNEGEINILVSTSVIEVGVDVPNATIMMIEGSERFGLAQLYQFRGRVGRGEHQSFCFLFTDSSSQTTHKRLSALLEAQNGFELAEKDLEIRGPGEFLGESQTGIPDLAMKALKNPELIKISREAAEKLIKEDPELKNYPLLKKKLELFKKEVHLE